jgi:hypothetical protein
LFQRRVAVVQKMAQHCITGTNRLPAVARTSTRTHAVHLLSTSARSNTTVNNETVGPEWWLKYAK